MIHMCLRWLSFLTRTVAAQRSIKFAWQAENKQRYGFRRASLLGNARDWRQHGLFEFCSSFGDHLEAVLIFASDLDELLAIWSLLHPSLLFLPFLFLWPSGPFLRPYRIVSCGCTGVARCPLTICVLPGASSSRFGRWSFHPFLREQDSSPVMPENRSPCVRRSYRCLFSFASSHRRTALEWSMYYLLAIHEVTTYAPKNINRFLLRKRCLLQLYATVARPGISPVGVLDIEDFESTVRTWRRQISSLCGVSWRLNRLTWISEAARFSTSSHSAMSKSPYQLPPAHGTHPMTIAGSICVPDWCCLASSLSEKDGLATGFGSKRDQRSIGCCTTSFLIRCLAIGHLVVHVPQAAITFHRTVPPSIG